VREPSQVCKKGASFFFFFFFPTKKQLFPQTYKIASCISLFLIKFMNASFAPLPKKKGWI
jgi:hypothetical protein